MVLRGVSCHFQLLEGHQLGVFDDLRERQPGNEVPVCAVEVVTPSLLHWICRTDGWRLWQVFPELSAEEEEEATGGVGVGAAIVVDDDDDEQEDEDFVVDGDEDPDEDEDDDAEEEKVVNGLVSDGDPIDQEPLPIVSEHVSDDELQYLSKDDVILSDR